MIGDSKVGLPVEMIYADAYLAKGPFNVEHLIASRLDAESIKMKRVIAAAKRKAK
jgi:hypothetical protein